MQVRPCFLSSTALQPTIISQSEVRNTIGWINILHQHFPYIIDSVLFIRRRPFITPLPLFMMPGSRIKVKVPEPDFIMIMAMFHFKYVLHEVAVSLFHPDSGNALKNCPSGRTND